MSRRALLFSLVFILGCGSGAVQLTRDEYDRLPRDARQEVFDAENDLVITRNRQDDARERKQRIERAREDLDERWKRTEKRLSSRGGSAYLSEARKVVEAHKAFLEAELEVAEAGIKVTIVETEVTQARLELVRQRQLARIGRVATASVKDFEERVTGLEKRVKSSRSSDLDLRSRAQMRLDAWKAAEERYARLSGDYDTGIWFD